MARIERSLGEKRRTGMPSDQGRIDVLERIVAKLVGFSIAAGNMQGGDPDRQELGDITDKLDQLDIDFPDAG